ncbi:filamentous hemagglutinin N-terminal domain-containing protein [Scytonema sp. UIC 10036]|uniref:two-partner secretion domain-containing protein n=1 Tax=Scytonema sp. UIC 10036 TaxID=2304196 RepID=UPI0012DA7BC1|nr:filamentous hemagglutinin N-terminal domain-containing protein [Scytonema sp. UIC 10036]MUG92417.1 filamentous hemagglutinin N-terminal domain-containing protein [Scytonema sp. UIC 10036]
MKLFKPLFFFFPLCSIASLVPVTIANAQQVIPDNSLGSESSVVNQNVEVKGSPGDRIDGGATRGTSLFHSFEKFDVNSNGRVYFNPQSNIQNIFSRVTGGNPSNIQGTLGVLNSANLFFINPNGILFGPNAKLDVGGSFLASTANSLLFGNQFEFSATSKLAPPQLLTVNIPTGLRFRDNPVNTANPVNITVESYSQDINGNYTGLEVLDGKSIALVGGDILVDYGRLVARGGRIELGGVRGTGEIGLDGNTLQLNFPDNVVRANVRLRNYGEVIVRGSGGGNIAINAKDIEISDDSLVQGGISLSPTVPTGAQAGDVTLNATGAIEISDDGRINNDVINAPNYSGNIISGNGGNINIKASSFSMTGGAELSASTFAKGNAGNVNLRAENSVSLTGSGTAIFSSLETGSEGKGGNISITVDKGSLSMRDGSSIVASVYGKGNAGNVNLRAENGTVALSNGDIFSNIEAGGDGKGGVIDITAKSLSLSSGTQLQTLIRAAEDGLSAGRGEAGSANLRAEEGISLTGSGTRIFSDIGTGGEGKGGNVSITVDKGSFNMNDGARIDASTAGKGDAGNVTVQAKNGNVVLSNGDIFSNIEAGGDGKGGVIDITAKSLSLSSGTQLQTLIRAAEDGLPAGRGEGGNVNLRAEEGISLTGSGTRIFSDIGTGGEGKGGNVSITVDKGSFNMNDGARIDASTAGKGDAGNVTVQAKNGNVVLSNGDIFSNIEAGGDGKGGVIDITAKSLSLSSGTQLQTLIRAAEDGLSAGRGEGGNINLRVENDVSLTGSDTRIVSRLQPGGEGKGGNVSITVDKGSLNMSDGSRIIASTSGKGDAGNVTVRAENGTVALSNSYIFSNIEAGGDGKGGVIDITANSLSLSSGTQLQTLVREADDGLPAGRGEGGNVNLRAENDVSLTGSDTRIFSSLERGSEGKGGNVSITVNKGSLNMSDGSRIIASTSGKGNAGNVTVRAENSTVALSSGYIFSNIEAGGDGKGGVIDITAKSLSLNGGAQLQTLVRQADDGLPAGRGEAGDVIVRVEDNVSLTGSGSAIFSRLQAGSEGKGGNVSITVNKGSLTMSNGAQINVSTFGKGNTGNVTVRAENGSVFLTGSNTRIFSSLEPGGEGKGGNVSITVDKGSFNMNDGARIIASTAGKGDAGNVTVQAKNGTVVLSNGDIFSNIEAGGDGKGGVIDITSQSLSLSSGTQLQTLIRAASNSRPAGRGEAGIVNLRAEEGISLTGSDTRIFSSLGTGGEGKGGNISIAVDKGSFNMNDGARIIASTAGKGDAGNITVRAENGNIVLSNGDIFSNIEAGGDGKGGVIDITAQSLSLSSGTQLQTLIREAEDGRPAGRGEGGNVNLRTKNDVSLTGSDTRIISRIQPGGEGKGGNVSITVDKGSLNMSDGSRIIASTSGKGNAGNVTVQAENGTVILSNSDIFSNIEAGGDGKGGVIDITANSLYLSNGAQLQTSVSQAEAGRPTGKGDAGSVIINAKTFEATNGGQVTTSTSGSGKAGNIIFRVSDRILVSGSDSGFFSSTNSQGDGGSIDIDPKELILRDGATISVNSEGSGNGGSIKIGAGILRLDNAKITAETQSARGGDIELNLQDLLILRRGSTISATAGRAQGRGDGGNITINIPDGVIIAFPQENSDITANAFEGRGGNITIRGALLGIAPLSRQQLQRLDPNLNPNNVPTSDITAISQQQPQQEGSVRLNTEIDPNRGLVELPEEVTDSSKEIAQNPCQRGVASQFIVTGRGGLPTSPVQTVNSNNVQVDLVAPVTSAGDSASTSQVLSSAPNPKRFVPAQGWVFNEKGEVVLTAYDPANIGAQRPLRTLTPTSCAVR